MKLMTDGPVLHFVASIGAVSLAASRSHSLTFSSGNRRD